MRIFKRYNFQKLIFALVTGFLFFNQLQILAQAKTYEPLSEDCLANGQIFPKWDKEQNYLRTYYVDGKNPKASDSNADSSDT